MKHPLSLVITLALFIGATDTLTPQAVLATPALINFQGALADSGGSPVADGNYSVVFTIWDAASGGTSVWTETQSVFSSDGRFNTLLGSVNPVTDAVFNGTTRYLGMAVDSDPEMTPRTALVSVPYAVRVSTVDGASGGNIIGKVAIGPGHTLTGDSATITGGSSNTATGIWATVAGGKQNSATLEYATVSGGRLNVASSGAAVVGGGLGNNAIGEGATVAGGSSNTAEGNESFIGGGTNNRASGFDATIAGGTSNAALSYGSTVGGGILDTAGGAYSTVSGGEANAATAFHCTVSGGVTNRATDSGATVSGGKNNVASGSWSTVSGGFFGDASGDYSTVAGGLDNRATGSGATVPGGEFNWAAGARSLAAGFRARAGHDGTFVWADNTTQNDFTSTNVNQFLIQATGGVGIGTNSPQALLDVDGEVRVNVIQIMGGSDIVEGFESVEENIEPGTVMIIDDLHPGLLKPSVVSYDRRVAGVVSGAGGIQPGIHLGQGELNGNVKVALAGRVYVRCSAVNGPILPGDALTTSDTPGHAMKATETERSHGTLIGKAMGGLSDGTGLVLVLVNLQ